MKLELCRNFHNKPNRKMCKELGENCTTQNEIRILENIRQFQPHVLAKRTGIFILRAN